MQKNQDKMTEQQFLRILRSSVCGIVLCLVGLVSTTWAWYSMEIECTNNVIQVGQFDAVVTVIPAQDGEEADSVWGDPIDTDPGGEHLYDLNAGSYRITVTNLDESTSPCYCIVNLWDYETYYSQLDGEIYHTKPIYPEETMTFELILKQDYWMEVIPTLGKSSAKDPVESGGEITPGQEKEIPAESYNPTNPSDPEGSTDSTDATDSSEEETTP